MASGGEVLRVSDIHKSFGKLQAVDGVSFSLAAEKITILIGPNGSGKTTLVNVISGYYKPDEGEVFYKRTNITGWPPHRIYRAGIARTFQIPSLFVKLSVLENVLAAERANPGESFLKAPFPSLWDRQEAESTERAVRILDLLGLSEVWNQQASTLSGGQMKLLEMGRALMSGAKVLLLDEPISGVNPTLAHEIFGALVRSREEMGVTFLIIEHRLDIALGYVDHAIAMAFGKVIASGSSEDVISDPGVVEAYLGG